MESKEAFIKIREIMNEYHHYFIKENIKVETIEGYPLDQIEKDLERLEQIDNANSSEALKCLKNNSELFDKIAKENPTTYKNETFAEAFLFKTNTIKIEQALLKAQEQDKILELIKKCYYVSSIDNTLYKTSYGFDNPQDIIKIGEWLNNGK